jgi:hypothetical protein
VQHQHRAAAGRAIIAGHHPAAIGHGEGDRPAERWWIGLGLSGLAGGDGKSAQLGKQPGKADGAFDAGGGKNGCQFLLGRGIRYAQRAGGSNARCAIGNGASQPPLPGRQRKQRADRQIGFGGGIGGKRANRGPGDQARQVGCQISRRA